MRVLLERLGLVHLGGTTSLQSKLEEVQMDYLRRIGEVIDPVRRLQMQNDLKEIEAAIEYLATHPKIEEKQPAYSVDTEENFDDLKGKVRKKQKRIEVEDDGESVSECDRGLELLQSGDIEQAIAVLTRAAENNNYAAMYNLGIIFYRTEYGKHDMGKAFYWLRRTAEIGDPVSMNIIGCCYANGDGVVQDCQKACEWYQKAANAGYVDAIENLAEMYWNGTGVGKNEKKAIELFEEATGLGSIDAQYTLGTILLNRGELSRGRELVEQSAQAGLLPAMGTIGFIYLRGIGGIKKDTSKALRYLRPAVEAGEPEALAVYGMMLKDGDGVEKDEKLARQLVFKAASMDNQRAIAMLANWTR